MDIVVGVHAIDTKTPTLYTIHRLQIVSCNQLWRRFDAAEGQCVWFSFNMAIQNYPYPNVYCTKPNERASQCMDKTEDYLKQVQYHASCNWTWCSWECPHPPRFVSDCRVPLANQVVFMANFNGGVHYHRLQNDLNYHTGASCPSFGSGYGVLLSYYLDSQVVINSHLWGSLY